MPTAAHAVYQQFAAVDGEFAVRDEMILRELPQVQFIASRILERLPQQVELNDLIQAGIIGLLEAYRSFDSTKNAQFHTFARFRIKGAILDSLRALDWGSRSIRRKAREITEATQKLQGTLGRHPTKEEIAGEMKISLAELTDLQTELNGLNVMGQEVQSTYEGESTHDLIDSTPSSWESPFEMYCKAEERHHLADAVSQLSEREQLILSLYYREELTMKEVAQVVGLAVSRVSQIHAATILKLKTSMKQHKPNSARPELARNCA
jgi:RNA polymerase sigma factor for flagellar operon FliA